MDWSAPWLRPWQRLGAPVEQAWRAGRDLPAALNQAQAAGLTASPVHFVPQASLPAGMAYEDYIFNSKQCPTREGYHDFFNGICWLGFPASKTRLNALQAAAIAAQGASSPRGPVRDAVTVFDENGALLDAPEPLWAALLAKDWQALFIRLRPLWVEARLLLWGHALLEKLLQPRKPVVAHVYRAGWPPLGEALRSGAWAALDDALAGVLAADTLATKPFCPLPVLGVPGWWPANETAGFYDDTRVFRVPHGLSQRGAAAEPLPGICAEQA